MVFYCLGHSELIVRFKCVYLCSELGGDSEVSSQCSVRVSGL